MTQAATRVQPLAETPPTQPRGTVSALRIFFFLARHAPWLPAMARPLLIRLTAWSSKTIRHGTKSNARLIFGRELSRWEQARFTREVVGSFYDFVVGVGRGAQDWQDCVATVTGREQYDACRRSEKGALLVTLHMGSFEAGLAALRSAEPNVNVVFLRDPFTDFESARTALRTTLGVRELALNEGILSLMAIPNALRRNEVVVMQGDRAYPGQKSQVVPFLHGHLRLPLGPIRIAQMCGSPIVPVAAIRRSDGRFDIHLGEPIQIADEPAESAGGMDPVEAGLQAMAKVFERWVADHPQQWLALQPVFVEDESESSAQGVQ